MGHSDRIERHNELTFPLKNQTAQESVRSPIFVFRRHPNASLKFCNTVNNALGNPQDPKVLIQENTLSKVRVILRGGEHPKMSTHAW